MTRDDIIRMAGEAGFRAGHIELYGSDPMPFVAPCSATDCMPELERFAALVAAAERAKLYALPGAQPAPSVPNLDMDALERQNDDLKAEVGRLRDALALIADQYEPKCSLLIPSIARTALNATGAYGQKESPESWPTEAMVTAFAELFNVRDQKNTFGPAFRAALAAAAPEAKP